MLRMKCGDERWMLSNGQGMLNGCAFDVERWVVDVER